MAGESIESRRYRLLVEQMGEEVDRVRGWQNQVASRLGVSPSYISKIANGEARAIGPGVIARARTQLGIGARFFSDAELTEPNWQEYIDVLPPPLCTNCENQGGTHLPGCAAAPYLDSVRISAEGMVVGELDAYEVHGADDGEVSIILKLRSGTSGLEALLQAVKGDYA